MDSGEPLGLTVSIGVSICGKADTAAALVNRADKALYRGQGLRQEPDVLGEGRPVRAGRSAPEAGPACRWEEFCRVACRARPVSGLRKPSAPSFVQGAPAGGELCTVLAYVIPAAVVSGRRGF
ncbi:MAG: hypothetical protein MZV70_60890 [Desulfobacterales bacterium]|nr:hypothetical protein [Desulfobacterales bacterium]